jgi:hypothetical protein
VNNDGIFHLCFKGRINFVEVHSVKIYVMENEERTPAFLHHEIRVLFYAAVKYMIASHSAHK